MILYYYWSELEGCCVKFNFSTVGKGTADDVIKAYLNREGKNYLKRILIKIIEIIIKYHFLYF